MCLEISMSNEDPIFKIYCMRYPFLLYGYNATFLFLSVTRIVYNFVRKKKRSKAMGMREN